jgi:isoquinoline 1-oxidoreductase alpha subunit
MAIEFELNGEAVSLEVDPGMPLLWAIRDIVGLTGTKYSCGKALCGACTVHVNGQPMRSCVVPVTCQSGQIMSAVALLERTPNPTDDDIDQAMSGNICRCGTYTRIRKAIHRAAEDQS